MAKLKKGKKDKSKSKKTGAIGKSREQRNASTGGGGRVDKVEPTGVYPLSTVLDSEDPEIKKAPIVAEGEFGQGERGIEGYFDSGESEIRTELEIIVKSSGGAESSGAKSGKEGRRSKS